MVDREYEFRHISTRQKFTLIAVKVAVLLILGSSLGHLVLNDSLDLGQRVQNASFVFTAMFIYTNLMTVRVEVQELFEYPVVFRCYEFFWISMILMIGSYFL